MQGECNIGLNFLPKCRIDKRYWFKIHRVVTNFKPIGKVQLLQDGGSYNDMLQRCGVFIEFLMFQGNIELYCIVLMNLCEPERNAIQIEHHSFVKATFFVMQKLMHCTMCTASIRLAQCTAVYRGVLYSVSERRYTTCTVLLHSSKCRFYISRSHVQFHAML